MLMLVSMTLALRQGHSGSAKTTIQGIMFFRQLSRQLATTVALFFFLRDLDFANVYIWLDDLGFVFRCRCSEQCFALLLVAHDSKTGCVLCFPSDIKRS